MYEWGARTARKSPRVLLQHWRWITFCNSYKNDSANTPEELTSMEFRMINHRVIYNCKSSLNIAMDRKYQLSSVHWEANYQNTLVGEKRKLIRNEFRTFIVIHRFQFVTPNWQHWNSICFQRFRLFRPFNYCNGWSIPFWFPRSCNFFLSTPNESLNRKIRKITST